MKKEVKNIIKKQKKKAKDEKKKQAILNLKRALGISIAMGSAVDKMIRD